MKKTLLSSLRTGFRLLLLLCVFLIGKEVMIAQPRLAAYTSGKKVSVSIMDSLMAQESVSMLLESDFDHFKQNRKVQDYQPAEIRISGGAARFDDDVEIRPRGKFRCMNCNMPPIKLKFSKKELLRKGYPEWNEFKIVLPCYWGRNYEQLVIKEYLTYRLYMLLTDYSYRVKLIELQLKDSEKPKPFRSIPAILLEHHEEVAGRLEAEEIDRMGLESSRLKREDYNRMQVFEFMIGNTDWAPNTSHNMSCMRLENGDFIPIPYDFDFCGLVDAEYALPNSMTSLPDVLNRFFMGNGKNRKEMEQAFDLFREKREEMYGLINNCEPLRRRHRKSMIRYLDSFFEIINHPRLSRKYFIDKPDFLPEIY